MGLNRTYFLCYSNKIFHKVEDAAKVQICFEEQKITFSAVQYELLENGKPNKNKIAKQFRNEIDLYDKIDPEVTFGAFF